MRKRAASPGGARRRRRSVLDHRHHRRECAGAGDAGARARAIQYCDYPADITTCSLHSFFIRRVIYKDSITKRYDILKDILKDIV